MILRQLISSLCGNRNFLQLRQQSCDLGPKTAIWAPQEMAACLWWDGGCATVKFWLASRKVMARICVML